MIINIICDNNKSWIHQYLLDLVNWIKDNFSININLYSNTDDIYNKSDISVFLWCEKIVKKDTMLKSKYNLVVHESDLPKWKWMSPLTWQVLEWKNSIPITLFEMSEWIDDGDYYYKDEIILNGSELVEKLRLKQYEISKKLI